MLGKKPSQSQPSSVKPTVNPTVKPTQKTTIGKNPTTAGGNPASLSLAKNLPKKSAEEETPKAAKPISGGSAIQKVEPASSILASRPEFLRETEIIGTEALNKYVTLPRLKIVQQLSHTLTEKGFTTGDIVYMPSEDIVAPIQLNANGNPGDRGTPFHVIPIAFYEEWCQWNDLKLRGTEPAIAARTFDPEHEIAKLAKDPEQREQIDGRTKLKTRFVEHLNFVVMISEPDHPLDGSIAVVGFSRGSHKDGRHLARLLKMRNASPFACVFKMQSVLREKDNNKWYVIEVSNPDRDSGVSPWVQDRETYEMLKEKHLEIMSLVKNDRLRVDLEDESAETFVEAETEEEIEV